MGYYTYNPRVYRWSDSDGAYAVFSEEYREELLGVTEWEAEAGSKHLPQQERPKTPTRRLVML